MGEQAEAIECVGRLMRSYRFPAIVSAAFVRLADLYLSSYASRLVVLLLLLLLLRGAVAHAAPLVQQQLRAWLRADGAG